MLRIDGVNFQPDFPLAVPDGAVGAFAAAELEGDDLFVLNFPDHIRRDRGTFNEGFPHRDFISIADEEDFVKDSGFVFFRIK